MSNPDWNEIATPSETERRLLAIEHWQQKQADTHAAFGGVLTAFREALNEIKRQIRS